MLACLDTQPAADTHLHTTIYFKGVKVGVAHLFLQDSSLHLAARLGSIACAKLLLTHQATQDLRNIAGATPYVCALLEGHKEMAELLKASDYRRPRNLTANQELTLLLCAPHLHHIGVLVLSLPFAVQENGSNPHYQMHW